jgi:hydroxyquinol 1,2-dioxygenase
MLYTRFFTANVTVTTETHMRAIDENTITDAALEQMASTPDPRLKQIMAALTRHLHDFAREVDLTPDEWLEGIKFLTAVGQKCTAYRQEFILLSDTLGLSSLVNALHDRRATEDATKSSLVGPFYRQDSPNLKLGDTIVTKPTNGLQVCLYGRVTNAAGKGVANATVQVWQPDETGNYDLQKHDPSEMDLRGTFRTDADGRYYLRTIAPLGYMIPMDGPVGDMIRAQKRHGYRPAHIHFIIGGQGYREVVTALYLQGDEHIDSDTVFGVTASLVTDVKKSDPDSPIPNLPAIRFDFQIPAAAAVGSGRVGADPSQIVKKAAS